jgi:hypothetical protein
LFDHHKSFGFHGKPNRLRLFIKEKKNYMDSYHQRREKKNVIYTKGSSRGTFHSPAFKVVLLGKELSTNNGIESINE